MKTIWMIAMVLSVLALAACGAPSTGAPSGVSTPAPSVLPTMPPSPLESGSGSSATPAAGQDAAVANSRQDLAERLNVDPDTITLVSVEAVEWPDGCLGIQTPGVMCTMVITPGYLVILEAEGKQYEYHTNATGDVARLATTTP